MLFAFIMVESNSKGKLFNDPNKIPYRKVGLVLGTAKYQANSQKKLLNPYYENRLKAAQSLWQRGKIKYLLLSGDNSSNFYNEPKEMFADLVKMGVDSSSLILDYAGLRTLDSVVRSKAIFGQDSITVISQSFHNKRAIFIAEQHNINAIAYNADKVSMSYGLKTQARELLARVKMLLDLFIKKEPKHLGDQIVIP